ncbi:hypothetical protein LRP52_48535 [Photobacterium sp. ZSDE20]|uniref:Uncharacterized protein n=1 Tax=Photobacterium pectinilyticum TaxID=2906793 RepID=A0ABT1NCE0_9GAMM|nr:hypothetical protein [Photobacterium sp. ZSDE20]MCQ1061331.1 hypothetical protein [Photobacterium sp. ZSDE20]MDD1829986.1 hypothetical protein [Photobacterium sp. ZSDE20]
MKLRLSLCATSVALILAGCGSDSGSTGGGESASARTITAIDGYLGNAIVCVDRNANQKCDDGEALDGRTALDGTFTIPAADAGYDVIVKVARGEAKDTDQIGFVDNTYELLAKSDSDVVTPFTTLAVKAGTTLEVLASELGLDLDVLSGDYIKAQESADQKEAAIIAHKLAQGIARSLPEDAESIDAKVVMEEAALVLEYINDKVNKDGIDSLGSSVIAVENGEVVEKLQPKTLQEYLIGDGGRTWDTISTNLTYASEEGIQTFNMTQDILCLGDNSDDSECIEIDEDKLTITSEGESDEFIYLSTDLALAVPVNDLDLILWTKHELLSGEPMDIVVNDFSGQTWYAIFDDSGSSQTPEPTFTQFDFGAYDADKNEGKFTYTGDGETEEATWSIEKRSDDSEQEYEVIKIHLPEGENPYEVSKIADTGSLVIMNEGSNHDMWFNLYTQDKALAESIMEKWQAVND